MVGSAEEAENPIDVRVVDVVPDINVFPPHECPTMEQAFFRVMCISSSGKGGPKMFYVWEDHLVLLDSILSPWCHARGRLADLSADSGAPAADYHSAAAADNDYIEYVAHVGRYATAYIECLLVGRECAYEFFKSRS